ncbi:MAG: hypothetical protein JW765_08240 [Deltaproteobacteria bacterium]|nr:hypothetical protein [Candidatus Zymogenaceae bacterium]
MTTELNFTASPALGRLCRWLRTLGFDCIYLHQEDRTAPDRSCSDRIYLTRHVDPNERSVIFIGQDKVLDQLKVLDMLISLKRRCVALSRCIRCNTTLINMNRHTAKLEVPEHVFISHDRFTRCPSCGRIYWPGTHVDRMEERISKLFS